jgi:hypothetical protein
LSRQANWGKPMEHDVALLNSITDKSDTARGKVVVCGSHGGLIAGALAAAAGCRAVVLNDAGMGMDLAGIEGVKRLADIGMAAAAVDCNSAEIGSAQDMYENGIISYANLVAATLGVQIGQPVLEAVEKLVLAPMPIGMLPAPAESRWEHLFDFASTPILCVDSASLITPADKGRIIVTGSHGGLIGGDPKRACKANAALVVFSDAGRGKNDIGTSRLTTLDHAGTAAVTVDSQTCKIGSAASTLETGVVSCVNQTAASAGLYVGQLLQSALFTFSLSTEN